MIKKLLSIVMAIAMVLGMSTSVFASEKCVADKLIMSEENIIESAYDKIKEQIIDDYSQLYKLEDFSYDCKTREEFNKKYIDINVYVDMTLTRHPLESPYVKGMQEALRETNNKENKESLQLEIDNYVNEIETLYYNIPNQSTFTYSISLNDKKDRNLKSKNAQLEIFYRTDTDDETLLIDMDRLAEVENQKVEYQQGYQKIENISMQKNIVKLESDSKESVSYNRLDARDWARENYDATPEYPSTDVKGTDCANFVSKAINAGGIPQDKDGKWYQAAKWGGWPGDHWFRTGYNGTTGVVIYMTNKDYFYSQSDESKVFAGSIMYWNNTSHVALVTYGDGSTIKYTQHGASQTKDTVYRSEDASFYMPDDSILE